MCSNIDGISKTDGQGNRTQMFHQGSHKFTNNMPILTGRQSRRPGERPKGQNNNKYKVKFDLILIGK